MSKTDNKYCNFTCVYCKKPCKEGDSDTGDGAHLKCFLEAEL